MKADLQKSLKTSDKMKELCPDLQPYPARLTNAQGYVAWMQVVALYQECKAKQKYLVETDNLKDRLLLQ